MQANEIYIEGSPGERRAGMLDQEGRVIGFAFDRPTRPRFAEAVYRSRVQEIDKRTGAAFLDLGLGTPALLSRGKGLTAGEMLTVQIARDSHADKGAAAVRQVVLWGRYLAFQPGRGGGFQCARQLGQGKRRADALARAEAAIEDPTDLILRGPAAAAEQDVLAREAELLRARWTEISSTAAQTSKPECLSTAPGFVELVLREAAPDARVALDDRLDFAHAETLIDDRFPDLARGLAFHDGKHPIFDEAGLNDALEMALADEVAITGGGRITIEETRALTAIDVDIGGGEQGLAAGPEAQHRLNRRAAEEIGRQILLRNLSGLIAIDFAGFTQRGKMKALIDILRSRLKHGEGHCDILGITAAGLVEVTRQRTGPGLGELMTARTGGSTLSPDAEAAEALRRTLRLSGAGKPVATLSAAAIACLKGPMRQALVETERRLGQPITLIDGPVGPDCRLQR
ncbi:MAG: ribonuclease E/G [Alphaproteobacteria bacterium]